MTFKFRFHQIALLFCVVTSGFAAPGDLDTSFGEAGIVITDIDANNNQAFGAALQSDGKIVAAGNSALVRYLSNGNLDPVFGDFGVASIPFSGNAVALDPSGKIIVSSGSGISFGAIRYDSNGSPDPTFNGTGSVSTLIGNSCSTTNVAAQNDGKIILVGYSRATAGESYKFTVARYRINGTLDPAFNGIGIATVDVGLASDYATCVAVQSDGRIVVAGYSQNAADSMRQFAIARFNSNGSLDTTFHNLGYATTPILGFDEINSIALQNDGKIVVAGYAASGAFGSEEFAIARYHSDGNLDTTFNGNGIATAAVGFRDYGNSVIVQRDGKLTVTGFSGDSNLELVLMRFTSNGMLDANFNGTGKVTTVLNDYRLSGNGIVEQSDGGIFVVGGADDGDHFQFLAARYLGSTPTTNTGAANAITKTEATLQGSANPNGSPASCYFEYGPTISYGSQTPTQSIGGDSSVVDVMATIQGLSINATYHYRLVSVSAYQTSFGVDTLFRTDVDPPTAVTGVPTNIAGDTATLKGMVNPNLDDTTAYFEYGPSTAYGSTTSPEPIPASSGVTPLAAAISNLQPGVSYHYRIVATNRKATTTGSDVVFTPSGNGGNPTSTPTVVTGSATGIGIYSATLRGTANPNGGATVALFEYGTTTTYGKATPAQGIGSGNTVATVSLPVESLLPGTLYHYRLAASNSLGTSQGQDVTLMTAFQPPSPLTGSAEVGTTFATLRGSVNANNVTTTVVFEYGSTITLGQTANVQGTIFGATEQPVSIRVQGLIPQTTYYYRVTATSTAGVTQGAIESFATSGAQPPIAVADTLFVTSQSASLNVILNDVNADTGETSTGLLFDGITQQGQFGVASGGPVVSYDPNGTFPLTGDSFQYRIKSAANLKATGTVKVLPFAAFRGAYGGVIGGGGGAGGKDGGSINPLELTVSGAFTGSLRWQGKQYVLKDSLGFDGSRVLTKPKVGAPAGIELTVSLRLDASGIIAGELIDEESNRTFSFVLQTAGFAGSNSLPGTYTSFIEQSTPAAALDGDGNGAGALDEIRVPGSGFTLTKIKQSKKKRSGTFIGQVPDGEPFSRGSAVFGDSLPLDAPLYPQGKGKKKAFRGFVVGETLFTDASLDSILDWVKESGSPGLYPQGFRNGLLLRGDRLFKDGDNPVAVLLGLLGSDVRLEFRDGDLPPKGPSSVYVADAKITLKGGKLQARITSSDLGETTVKVSAATGMFTGKFKHPDPTVLEPVPFKGILRRLEEPVGRGNFRGPVNAGSVRVFKSN